MSSTRVAKQICGWGWLCRGVMGKCLSKCSATVQPIFTPPESVDSVAPPVVGSWTDNLDTKIHEREKSSPTPSSERIAGHSTPGFTATLSLSNKLSGSTQSLIETGPRPPASPSLLASSNKLSASTEISPQRPASPSPLTSSSSDSKLCACSSTPPGTDGGRLRDTGTVPRSVSMEPKENDHGDTYMRTPTLSCENICVPCSPFSTNRKFVLACPSRYKSSESTRSLIETSHWRPASPPPLTSSSDSKLWASSTNRKFILVHPSRDSHPSAAHHLLNSGNKLQGSTRSLIETSHRRPANPSPLSSSSDSKLWVSSINHKFIHVHPSRDLQLSAARHLLRSGNKLPGSTRSLVETSLQRPANPYPLSSSSDSKLWVHSSSLLGDGDRPHDTKTELGRVSVGLGLPEKPKKAVTRFLPNDCSDPAVPTDFHPQFHETEAEARNRRTVSRLAPRENDASARNKVQQLLENWRESGVLSEIENHVLNVPTTATTTIIDLSASLTAPPAKYLTSVGKKTVYQQLAKAYAIYYWVARNICYDTSLGQVFDKGGYVDCMPQHVLQQRTAICAGYSNLFNALATRAHLKADVVHGNLKEWRSTMGGDFEPQRDNSHSWNAVYIGGVWFPLDCTFAGGSVVNHQFSPQFTRDYFACMPVKLALTHFPSDASWQLLHEPLALEELRPLIAPTITTLAMGVEPQVWSECVKIVHGSPDPVIQVSVRTEAVVRISAELKKSSVSFSTSDSIHTDSLADDESLDDKTFIQRTSDGYRVFAVLAHPGRYTLDLYSKLQHLRKQRLCLSYQVSCDTTTNVRVGYPSVFSQAAEKFEFQLLHWNKPQKAYVCESDEGQLAVAFRAKPGLGFSHCLIPGKVANPTVVAKSSYLYHCTMVSHDESDPSLYFLHVLFPAEGLWTIYLRTSISVSDTTLEHNDLLLYSVFSRRGYVKGSYPHAFSPDVNFGSLTPLCASGDEVFVVPFTAPRDFAFYSYLTFEQPTVSSKDEKLGDAVMIKKTESVPGANKYTLKVIFPSPGKWYVHVFVKDKHSPPEKNYVSLFNLCLKVEGYLNGTFPHLTRQAVEMGITLLSDELVLCINDDHHFIFQFLAPNELDFTQRVNLVSAATTEDPFLQHCVVLSPALLSLSPCLYTLKGLFPYAGKWSVMLIAQPQWFLAIQITVEIKTLIPNISFLKLYPNFHRLGLTVAEDRQTYSTTLDSPEFTLPFSAPESLSFSWDLQNSSTEEKFPNAIVLPSTRNVEDKTSRVLRIIFPQKGEWLLHLFAQQSIVLELRVRAEAYLSDYSFPQIFKSFEKKYRLALDSGSLPLVSRVSTIPYTLTIPFYSPPGVRFWHQSEITDDPDTDQYTTSMIQKQATGRNELMMEVVERGEWVLSLYVQLEDDTSKSWFPVLRHVITAQPTQEDVHSDDACSDSLWDD